MHVLYRGKTDPCFCFKNCSEIFTYDIIQTERQVVKHWLFATFPHMTNEILV